MKRFLLIVFLSGLFVDVVRAQEDSTQWQLPAERRQSRITLIKNKVLGTNYWEEAFRGNWAGIFVGLNGLAKTDYSGYPDNEQGFFDPDLARSYVIDINLIQLSKGLQRSRNTIGLVTGVGLELQSWYLDNRITVTKGLFRLQPVTLNNDDPQKSKFISSYLSIPFLAEFQIPMKHYGNRLYFSAGLIVHKRLTTHTKIKYTHLDKGYKLKSPDDYYLSSFRTSATFRIGYRWINLFASCDLQQLFITNKGPETFPYSAGFALVSF
ncbi:MAG: outer membrane beta-barrel protein [Mangrovibacterium sp.]|nr:outer membrane beta-barrel protein [Mangrovibacterium sp.]